MEKNLEIKKENRRALPQFIVSLLVFIVIGGVIGYLGAKYGAEGLAETLRTGAAFFSLHMAPWLLAALAVLIPLICIPLYRSAKALIQSWDGEDEDVSETAERKLTILIWITSAANILSFFLIAAVYASGLSGLGDSMRMIAFITAVAALVVILVETLILQQKAVDAIRHLYPEKKVSVYDMRFQKKWLEASDEAEKIFAGRCAFKAYIATNTICGALTMILAICALFFNIGFLPSLVVFIIWMVNLGAYCAEALGRPHSKG